MEIEYDREQARATDGASGLAVEFVEYGRPRERDVFLNLIWRGRGQKFAVIWDSGYSKIMDEHPNVPASEQYRLACELNERNYSTRLSDVNLHMLASEIPGFADVFTRLLHRVMSERHPWSRCTVQLRTSFNHSLPEWSYDG